ncbi:FimB/Mfa2 family fimbrial subunit [uncultured Bacteroides sp.]|uniref:FimB/Mfa2 family fimbrial subunit n=1 Tax=uncultured Bacteroides sp. TaxID=162156 RepID=UPI002AA91E84|nr:FimB/Mfa2 family fimbrial subunit [uncultured Bacteroides sp.]
MKIFKVLIKALFLLSALLAGCTEIDLSGNKNITLQFQYTADGTTDVLADYIGSVTLFVYDAETGKFIQSVKVDNAELLKNKSVNLLLDPGMYDIICWGNVEDNTAFSNVSSGESEAMLTHLHADSEQKIKTNDPLYYGKVILTVPSTLEETNATVSFQCAHIDVWVYVKGITDLSASGQNIPPIVCISNLYPAYSFSMQTQGEPLSYYPESAYREDKLVSMAHCSVLRFTENTSAKLSLYKGSTGELLDTVSISQFIADNQINISSKEEVAIPLLVEYGSLGITIKIPNWDEVSTAPEW